MKNNNIKLFLAVVILGLFCASASANMDPASTIGAYRQIKEFSLPKLVVPKVVEIPVSIRGLERADFLVLDKKNNTFEPSLLLTDKKETALDISVSDLNSGETISNSFNMVDNNESTYTDINMSGDVTGKIQITLSSKGGERITTDSLYLLLDTYVALPKTINIKAGDDLRTILATTNLLSQVVHFPKTSASKWVIEITYGQPLRVTEIRLGGQYSDQSETSRLRFLAQPDHEYSIYFDPDRRVYAITGEMANLTDNNDILKVVSGITKNNPAYVIADTDKDGIPDIKDNCVTIINTDQLDVNSNGRGDVCDDFDKDGIINSLDNCPNLPNYNQRDTDGDKIGDVCDGEESRVTEKYKWLPWLGIGGACLVVIILFVFTALSIRKKNEEGNMADKTNIISK